ncbi:hypothetical protein AVEN_69756-1 [Araneus ventricosus]|uniref:Uncharacterized protein n=1 Tax=Araneus ventricosus TaxID=182803 RepID=A0A4Y2CVM6_ARAVE|nr:hypothetical protein AVEN_69756-1 [Araneus ventricosus]
MWVSGRIEPSAIVMGRKGVGINTQDDSDSPIPSSDNQYQHFPHRFGQFLNYRSSLRIYPRRAGRGKPEGPGRKLVPPCLTTSRPRLCQRPICLATQNFFSEAPKLNDHWSRITAGTLPFEKILPVSNGKYKRGQRPSRKFAEKLRAFRPEIKKNGEEKEYIFPNTTTDLVQSSDQVASKLLIFRKFVVLNGSNAVKRTSSFK